MCVPIDVTGCPIALPAQPHTVMVGAAVNAAAAASAGAGTNVASLLGKSRHRHFAMD